MEVGKLPLAALWTIKSQEMRGSSAPGVHNYRLGQGGKKGWRQAKYSWVWSLAREGFESAGGWEAGSPGGYIISHPNLAPLPFLLTLGFFSDLCFFLISDLFVHFPPPAPDGLWGSKHKLLRHLMWNSLCFASSFAFSKLYYVWGRARNTLGI